MKRVINLSNSNEISFSAAPNKNYEKFFLQFNEINSLPIQSWRPTHLIGYFCSKYKQCYNSEYKFKFNTPAPSKCFEVFQMKKLGSLLSTDSSILKGYIDWAFETQVVKAKRKLTSISFLTNEKLLFEYKRVYEESYSEAVDRSKKLPQEYQSVVLNNGYSFDTFGDLAFLYKADKSISLFQQLSNINFDLNVLDRIV